MNAKRVKPENELLLLGRKKTFRIGFKGRDTVGQNGRPFRLGRKKSGRGRQLKHQEEVKREI